MYISLDWLKDFVEIPKKITAEELGLRLTMHTVEIDSFEKQSEKFKDIVVGKILEIKRHPNADRLSLVAVQVGEKNVPKTTGLRRRRSPGRSRAAGSAPPRNDTLSIVCGAPNIKIGQLVPVALVGAVLPNGVEIKQAEVRGEKSTGMLCAEDELELGDDHTGILILDKKAKVGQNLGDYFNMKDIVFEVDNKSITHRPDLWSHVGIAREISAFLNTRITTNYKRIATNKIKTDSDKYKLNVKVKDFELCPRYMGIMMDGIEIKDSPKWMQERLLAVGMRPINNIVDITNYIMLDLGQPLHAFDSSRIRSESDTSRIRSEYRANNSECEIVVRRAKDKEIIETLDGEKRELDKEMLVIADSSKPIAVAGVMGGLTSEIADNTSSIIIEAANFEPIQIRKTAQKLGLRTESSMRFEKSLDPNLCELAIARAVELVKELCPKAKVVSKLVDEKKFKLDQGPIRVDLDWLNKRVGAEIPESKVVEILKSLGFSMKPLLNPPLIKGRKSAKELEITVPTWRATRDVSIPEDIVEEVGRIYGYDNIEPAAPEIVLKAPEINKERMLERNIKEILSKAARLVECYNYSYVCEEQLKKLKIDARNHIKLLNPILCQHTILRQSLVPHLLENIKLNQAKYDNIGIFEIGNVFLAEPGKLKKSKGSKETLPEQEKRISIILAQEKAGDARHQAKGIFENLLDYLGLSVSFREVKQADQWMDKNETAEIIVNKRQVGVIAKVNTLVKNNLGLKKEIVAGEINFLELYNIYVKKEVKKYQEAPQFPEVSRDLAFVVNDKILYNEIRQEMASFNKLINNVELFDVYQGEKLGANKKNLAFHITYQAKDRTLTAEEVDKVQAKLIKRLEQKFRAQIRNF